MVNQFKPFTPSREDPQQLDARTVGRAELIDRVVARLTRTSGETEPAHTLLIGPRGAGKTHVIEVVLNRLRRQPDASAHLVVRVPEDVVGLGSYTDLLVEIVGHTNGPPTTNATALRAAEAQQLEALVTDDLGDRTLVLVIENLNRLLDAIGADGEQALCDWLEQDARLILLATAPLLRSGDADQRSPWFDAISPDYLDELTVAEGQELLIRLHQDDPELAAFLTTRTARSRLEAIAQLAGGLPRLWVIAAMCITTDSLARLVPAVEDLLERLVPYYQERLWELSALEAKVVRAIAEHGRVSVKDIAAFTGEDQRSVATTLRRLEEVRWVEGTKQPNRDQRKTFYELKEPLIRHHLDYRTSDRQALRFVVEVLRVWFDPPSRLRSIGSRDLGKPVVEYLAASLSDLAIRSDHAYASQSIDELLAAARLWASGANADTGSTAIGELVISILHELPENADAPVAQIGQSLQAALANVSDADRAAFQLLEAGWNGADDPQLALKKLSSIDSGAETRQFQLQVQSEVAYWNGKAGDDEAAMRLYEAVLADRTEHLGVHHPDTLSTRYQIAHYTGVGGDANAALELYIDVLTDRIEHLGENHVSTLRTRYQIANYTAATGDHDAARDQSAALLADQLEHLGPDHSNTLSTRYQLAYLTGVTGDPHTALELSRELFADQIEHLGSRHPDTLATQCQVAHHTAAVGDTSTALELYQVLVADLSQHAARQDPLAHAVIGEWISLVVEIARSDPAVFDRIPSQLRGLLEQPSPDIEQA